jgi:hypothetical protein
MQTYSFLDVAASLVGPGLITSLGNGAGVDEEGIDVQSAGDKSSMTIGADGSGLHNLNADKSGSVSIRLLKNSPQNQVLSAAYALQTASGSSHGQNTLVITNKSNGDTVTCTQGGFKKAPDLSFAKQAKSVEWVFDFVRIERTLGN